MSNLRSARVSHRRAVVKQTSDYHGVWIGSLRLEHRANHFSFWVRDDSTYKIILAKSQLSKKKTQFRRDYCTK
uniref:Uncharacterized protein n=1 Tax=Parascaris univalens TaxID=6257 RepID=A0A915C8P5_PARUN